MKLYYFDAYGRAEAIRMLLQHAKIDFEDIIVDLTEWPTLRSELAPDFGQLPILEDTASGLKKNQTNAILRYLGTLNGYYPKDPLEAWKVDSIIDAVTDMMNTFSKIRFTQEADKQKVMFMELVTVDLPRFLAAIEKRKSDNANEGCLVGEKLSIADFSLASVIFTAVYNDLNDKSPVIRSVFEQYPHLKAYAQYLQEHTFKDYLASRPKREY